MPADTGTDTGTGTQGTLNFDFLHVKSTAIGDPSTLANGIINTITLIAGILAVIYLIWMGIQYITAGGDAEKAGVAKQGIINAVIGIIIIVLAYGIAKYVANVI